jgi:hypothetical protein
MMRILLEATLFVTLVNKRRIEETCQKEITLLLYKHIYTKKTRKSPLFFNR